MSDFKRCESCNRIVDTFRSYFENGVCSTCDGMRHGILSFPDHYMPMVESYADRKVKEALKQVAISYLEKNGNNS